MKFGHYTNDELGIKRNITCSMFESKGVPVEPGRDVQCGLDNARESVKKELLSRLESYYGFKARDYQDCARKIFAAFKGGKTWDWEATGTDLEAIVRGFVGRTFYYIVSGLQKQGIPESAAKKLVESEKKKFEDAVRPFAKKIQQYCLKEKEELEKKMSNDLDETNDVECSASNRELVNAAASAMIWLADDAGVRADNPKDAAKKLFKMYNKKGYAEEFFANHRQLNERDVAESFFTGDADPTQRIVQDLVRHGFSKEAALAGAKKAIAEFEKACKPYVKQLIASFEKWKDVQASNELDEAEMDNDIDETEDVKCSRRRGRGRNMSNEIDKAQDVECAKKDWNKSFFTGEMHTHLNSYTRDRSFDGLSTDQRAKKLVEVFDRRLKATVKAMVADAKYDGADKDRVRYIQQLCEGIARENRNKWLKEFMRDYGLKPKKK